jgi:D-3-phosphoglycerate dehydrogenase
MVGFIGRILGEAGINIAMMNLTRHNINGKALSMVNVDSCIPEDLLEEMRAHPNILAARQIAL